MEYETFEQAADMLHSAVQASADDQLAFVVHYWGAAKRHQTNSPHKHSFYEACYVLDGSGEYEEEGTTFALKQGTLFLSRPHVLHQIRNERMALLWVGFDLRPDGTSPRWLERFDRLTARGPLVLHHADDTALVHVWRALCLSALQVGGDEQFLLERMTHVMLAMFPQTFLGSDAPPIAGSRNAGSKILKQAETYVRDNLGQPLQLEEVATYFYLSSRHLARLFRQELGTTFTAYVQTRRLQEAARLLRESELSVKQIADATGFGTVHYFTRLFRQHTGTPPALYRKLQGWADVEHVQIKKQQ
ncbi:AraC family transcriptional regulator [Paenibacillus methanolicus]|uniref:AraC-like protein n=1 Tax=Paenibacillus methanolicus TaxID=582686 RepID=A0A5S5CJJ7_9BACL|nr:AraC family transcriptional regulator [Paenibacillus methanolicus]TYP78935.1 AraC-like protein [Paenibacillus methanolicus]